MCLSIEVDRPESVLSKGEHAGFQWVTVHNGIGYRCGYVRVPSGHPWHGLGYDDVRSADGDYPDVHGGLTFDGADKPCDKGEADDGHWLGFDCAHSGDLPDPTLPGEHGRFFEGRGEIRTTEYVEAECRKLCEQAAAVAKP